MSILTEKQWEKIGVFHHHGMALPLGALHSKTSAGCGDFNTLQEFLPLVHLFGFDILQLLPLTDTGNDSSPYMGLSGNAINPLYLALPTLANFFSDPIRKNAWLALKENERKNPTRFDYQRVKDTKLSLLYHYLDEYQPFIEQEELFISFCKEQKHWLTNYATFKALKEQHNHVAWWDWPKEHQTFSDKIGELLQTVIIRWKVVQFLCFQQLSSVKKEAERLSINLMGDLPILLNKDSSDVWAHPELFTTNLEVGAPPDMYSKEGQRWGFPLYNWKEHCNQDLEWWKARLRFSANFYHMVRLDHIVGFYRLFAMEPNIPAKNGHFVPEEEDLCLKQGEKILTSLVPTTSMFPIGEDLGDIPDYVRESLSKFGLAGTKVMRWERFWHEKNQPYIPLQQYNPESVTTISTHDSSTLKEWIESEKTSFQEALSGWNLSLTSETPLLEVLRASHHTSSFFHINLLNEYLSACKEMTWETETLNRINIPGTISKENWTFQFKPSIEEMASNEELKLLIEQCLLS